MRTQASSTPLPRSAPFLAEKKILEENVMVCAYNHKTKTNYSEEALLAAVKAVKLQGMKWAAAARKFNVQVTTLFDHISGEHSQNRCWKANYSVTS